MGASAEGAEMITFLAPPAKCTDAVSVVVKIPVASTTNSAPKAYKEMLLRISVMKYCAKKISLEIVIQETF